MDGIVLVSLQFLACAAVICYAGAKLSRYGDRIADITGWTGSWVGLILLATVTSLPELATGISAVAFAKTPEMAVGDILGSCIVNFAFLAMIELLHRKETIYGGPEKGYLLSLSWLILSMTLATLAFATSVGRITVFHVSPMSPLLIVVYVFAMRSVFKEMGTDQPSEDNDEEGKPSEVRSLAKRFALAAVAVVVAASWLPFVALRLAELTGLGTTFVGTLMVALATSLPELVVTITAVRIGALQMAIAGLLGSNLINLAVLAVDDIFFLDRSLFSVDPTAQLFSMLTAIVMASIVAISVIRQPKPRVAGLTVGGFLLLVLFVGNSYNSYVMSGSAG